MSQSSESRHPIARTEGNGSEPKPSGRMIRVSLVTPGLAVVGLALVLALNATWVPGEPAPNSSGNAPEVLGKAQGYVSSVAFSADGNWVASGSSSDEEISLWQVAPGGREISLEDSTSPAFCVAFAQSGKTVASAHANGQVLLWDTAAGEVQTRFEAPQGLARCLAFSPDGQQLAVGTTHADVLLWNVPQGRIDGELHCLGSVNSLCYSPDGRTLATGQTQSAIQLWSVERRELSRTIPVPTDSITSVRFSPDGQWLASTSPLDWKVRLWDPATGLARACLEDAACGPASSLAFSPDGNALACGGSSGVITIWDYQAGRPTRNLRGHKGYVWSLAFSPDGQSLASGGDDKTVRLWDWAKGDPEAQR